MTISDLLRAGNIDEALALFIQKEGVENYALEYLENKRDIREGQVGKRTDKPLSNGKTAKVAKIPIPFQQDIIEIASAFLFGSPLNIDSDSANNQVIIDKWIKLRMDSILLKYCEIVKSETEAAIVFYSVEDINKNVKIKVRLLSYESGSFCPCFDEYGDLVAFRWIYKIKENGKDAEYMFIWTDDMQFQYKNDSGWKPTENTKPNIFGKIPVVYDSQKFPDDWKVKALEDRYEMGNSKNADAVDYFGSPIYKVKGSIAKLPEKDTTGKMVVLPIIETDSGKVIESDLEVLSIPNSPEMVENELSRLKELIYSLTKTPDLSFNNLKGLGNVAEMTLQLMFLGPILKAKLSESTYRTTVSRCLNVIVAGMARITKEIPESEVDNVNFNIRFTSVLPNNIKEIVETLTTASGGDRIISQQTAVRNNPLISDADAEIELIKQELQNDAFEPTI